MVPGSSKEGDCAEPAPKRARTTVGKILLVLFIIVNINGQSEAFISVQEQYTKLSTDLLKENERLAKDLKKKESELKKTVQSKKQLNGDKTNLEAEITRLKNDVDTLQKELKAEKERAKEHSSALEKLEKVKKVVAGEL